MSASTPGLPFSRIGTDSKKLSAPVIGISTTSPMFLSATVTASDSALSLRPEHVVHARACMYSSSDIRTESDSVSLYRRCTFEITPSHLPAASAFPVRLPLDPYKIGRAHV